MAPKDPTAKERQRKYRTNKKAGRRGTWLAHRVGLSRPQLTNGLLGRFGFGPEAASALKAYLVAT